MTYRVRPPVKKALSAPPDAKLYRGIHAAADSHAHAMQAAFLASAGVLRSSATPDWAAFERDLVEQLTPVIAATYVSGAQAAAELMPVQKADLSITLRAVFDLVNQQAVAVARAYAARLVTRLTEESRQAIASIVTRGQQGQFTFEQQGKLIERAIGLDEQGANALASFERNLYEQGVAPDIISSRGDAFAERLLRARGLKISRTEGISAANMGQLELWKQSIAAGYLPGDVKRKWLVTPDDRLCPLCLELENKILGMDELVTVGRFTALVPPLHPQCRCAMSLVIEDA